jgi:hypothetical protein
VLLTALCTSRVGGAAGSTSSLSWSRLEGAEGCIGTRQLAAAVEALLGREVFVSAARAEVSIEGRVRAGEEGWQAALTVADAEGRILGERQLDSVEGSCRSLDEPIALAIALMIDPDAALGPALAPPSAPEPALPRALSPQIVVEERLVYVPAAAPAAADHGASEEDGWQLGVRAGPSATVGLLPEIGFGVTAAVLVEPPWLIALEASAAIYLPRSASLEGHSADFALGYVGLAPCPLHHRFADLALALCAEVQLGRLWADGVDARGPWQRHQLVANLAPRARADYRIVGPLQLGLGLGAAIPLVREPFRLHLDDESDGELFRLPPVAAQADLAVGLTFL